jgi:hypothetical protein
MSCAGRLDVRTAVNQFRHDVPTKDARIRCDVWQPSLRSGWASAKPSTHESCAAAMVLFDAHDQVRTTVVEPPGAASCRPVSLVLMVVRVRPPPPDPPPDPAALPAASSIGYAGKPRGGEAVVRARDGANR